MVKEKKKEQSKKVVVHMSSTISTIHRNIESCHPSQNSYPHDRRSKAAPEQYLCQFGSTRSNLDSFKHLGPTNDLL